MSNVPSNSSGSHGDGNSSNSTTNVTVAAFDRVLEEFKKDLKKKDKDNFQMTSLQELNKAIEDIQMKHQTQRRMQNMTRLKRFIEAMDEYGKVIETFCNSSQFIPFIWVSLNYVIYYEILHLIIRVTNYLVVALFGQFYDLSTFVVHLLFYHYCIFLR